MDRAAALSVTNVDGQVTLLGTVWMERWVVVVVAAEAVVVATQTMVAGDVKVFLVFHYI